LASGFTNSRDTRPTFGAAGLAEAAGLAGDETAVDAITEGAGAGFPGMAAAAAGLVELIWMGAVFTGAGEKELAFKAGTLVGPLFTKSFLAAFFSFLVLLIDLKTTQRPNRSKIVLGSLFQSNDCADSK
jgi:hypothetical protein